MIIVTSSFSESSVFKVLSVHMFLNSSGLKSVFLKLRFCHGLVGAVSLTIEVKPSLKNDFFPAQFERSLSYSKVCLFNPAVKQMIVM